jgi:putative transposase
MLGFKNFRCARILARILLSGIECMHMIARGQMKCDTGLYRSVAGPFYSLAT